MIVLSELAAILPAQQQVKVKDYEGPASAIPERYLCLPAGQIRTAADASMIIETAEVDKLSMEEMCALLFQGKGKESELFRQRFLDED